MYKISKKIVVKKGTDVVQLLLFIKLSNYQKIEYKRELSFMFHKKARVAQTIGDQVSQCQPLSKLIASNLDSQGKALFAGISKAPYFAVGALLKEEEAKAEIMRAAARAVRKLKKCPGVPRRGLRRNTTD